MYIIHVPDEDYYLIIREAVRVGATFLAATIWAPLNMSTPSGTEQWIPMSTTDNLEVLHDEEYTIANGDERSHSVNLYNEKRVSRIQLERIPGAIITETGDELQVFWDRLRGKGRTRVGVFRSVKNILLSSCKPPTRFFNSYI